MQRLVVVLLLLIVPQAIVAQKPGGTPLSEPQKGKPILIPTRYEEHRFIALPISESGVQLSFFTDSAGGLFIFDTAAEKLKLTITTLNETGEGKQPSRFALLPSFNSKALIPTPLGTENGRLFVMAHKGAPATLASYDGMLGQQWFAGRSWTFDYPNKQLFWRATGDLPKTDATHQVKLFFQTNSLGKRLTNFARIPVEVDGEMIDFLFDTGATNLLPEDVLKMIGDGRPAERATSFLTKSQFEKWKQKHPEWRVLENIKTLTGTAMIQVPKIKIGGFAVGPVWFTVQPDRAFHEYMAQWMDKPTEGAIGGSALYALRVTVDWTNAIAVFEKP
jgi:hypothetical protein